MISGARMVFLASGVAVALALPLAQSRASSGDDDGLRALVDQNHCRHWREISRLTRARLAKGAVSDPKLLELSVELVDYCAGELDSRLKAATDVTVASGFAQSAAKLQDRARAEAAVVALYREALGSAAPANELAAWPYFANIIAPIHVDLAGLINRQFGDRTFERYFATKAKKPEERSAEERALLTTLQPWLEPL